MSQTEELNQPGEIDAPPDVAAPTPELQVHELAGLMPPMSEGEYQELMTDIARHGLLEPVVLYEGRVLDGRHRVLACRELGIPIRTRVWDGPGTPLQFVLSANVVRRHLTASQRAALAVEVERLLAVQARERQRHHGGTAPGRPSTAGPRSAREAAAGEAREQAARLLNTNAHYVTDAKRIAAEDPELLRRVRAGEITIPEARRELRQREEGEVAEDPGEDVPAADGPDPEEEQEPPHARGVPRDQALRARREEAANIERLLELARWAEKANAGRLPLALQSLANKAAPSRLRRWARQLRSVVERAGAWADLLARLAEQKG